MGFHNRQPDDEATQDPDQDPLSSYVPPLRRPVDRGSTQPMDEFSGGTPRGSGMEVGQADFASRQSLRRERRSGARVYPERLGEMARGIDNRQLLYLGAGIVFLLIALLAWQWSRRGDDLANVPLPETSQEGVPATGTTDELTAPPPGAVVTVAPEEAPLGAPAEGGEAPPAEEPPAPQPGEAFVVTGTGTQGLFLRAGPNTDSERLATLPEGTRVEALGEEQSDGTRVWKRVTTPQGEGWIAADFVVPAP
jgi:hypothetical protein